MKADGDMIVLSRKEFEAMLDRLEDAEDYKTVAGALAREKRLGAEAARADALSGELVAELSKGTHPVRVWRKHRAMTLDKLAAVAGVGQSYVTEIETRKKPGSLAAMRKLAAALKVPLDDLVAWI